MTNKTTFYWVLASLIAGRLISIAIYFLHGGCTAYGIEETLMATAFLVAALRTKDSLLRNLWGFGLMCGILELFSDFASVSSGTLTYNPHEPFVWDSPWYMPLTWLVCMFQITYVGLFLAETYGTRLAILTTGFGSVCFMLFIEWIAQYSGYWVYNSPHMVLGIPLYIIVCEIATCLSLVPVYQHFAHKKFGFVWSGLVLGAVILTAGELGFLLETGKFFIPYFSSPIHVEPVRPFPWK